MPITPTSYAHVRLTVTDIARSRAFYDEVLGLPVAAELPEGADAATREEMAWLFGGVVYQLGDSLLGLRPVGVDGFDENRTGLDHVSLTVGSRAELVAAAELLDSRGTRHDGVKDIGNAWVLEFRDPDGIALELYAAKG